VFEVIEAVKRASGHNFAVEIAARRPGDPPALVANVSRIRSALDWHPQFENLDTIVGHALAWERRLPGRQESTSA
jgi:UDP-glucose 4-epimerase